MESCSHPTGLVPLLYDGELDEVKRRQVSLMLADCPVCTRRIGALDLVQEALCRRLDEDLSRIDFSNFSDGVDRRIERHERVRSFASLSRFWDFIEALRRGFSWAPRIGLIAGLALIFGWVISDQVEDKDRAVTVAERQALEEPVIMVSRNQAQIESLSATSNLLVWNEPTSNVTVIWVDDTSEGAGR